MTTKPLASRLARRGAVAVVIAGLLGAAGVAHRELVASGGDAHAFGTQSDVARALRPADLGGDGARRARRRGRGRASPPRRVVRRVRLHDHMPDQLSGGQQQRVAIARALAMAPAVVLADEPTAALDSARSRDVMQLFRRVAHERGAAVVVVTHDHRTLDAFDTVYEMEDGRLSAHVAERTIPKEATS
jgi:ABC-type protease/lipase transport system fused ATPase/permease subunit